ncbi:DUF3552 domain-containing protein [Candidatus Peregrinibacteria bacterium]|nr:DUF3552 domain-containing protein [Candidatus Peregrinibacteria bacterium]
MNELSIILMLAGFAVGCAAGIFLAGKIKINIEETHKKAEKLKNEAMEKASEARQKAGQQAEGIRSRIAGSVKTQEVFLRDMEKSIKMKEDLLVKWDKKAQDLHLQEVMETERLSVARTRHEEIKIEQTNLLSKKAGKTTDLLKEEIIKKIEQDLAAENENKLKKLENYYTENAEKISRNILIEAMQKVSMPTSVEKNSSQILVPKDNLKAELVGLRAENIKELESLLEINVIFNDFPDTISVSSHNQLGRRIAEIAIDKLFKNKRHITPVLVREAVASAKAEAEKDIYKIGADAIRKIGIRKPLSQDLIKTIGRLYFRTSYGQNIMSHSIEVTYLANLLGGELGLNMDVCKISGFLHDLGKAIDQDPGVTGGHDQLTRDLMKKYGFSEEEIHAAWTHHEAEPAQTPEAMIVKAADAISAGRPGARQESIGKYLERIRFLEEIPTRFEGVKKSFAMSAGREVRVMVDPTVVEDNALPSLAKNIAKNIEEEVGYPGKVKINVIKRTVNTEYTK